MKKFGLFAMAMLLCFVVCKVIQGMDDDIWKTKNWKKVEDCERYCFNRCDARLNDIFIGNTLNIIKSEWVARRDKVTHILLKKCLDRCNAQYYKGN